MKKNSSNIKKQTGNSKLDTIPPHPSIKRNRILKFLRSLQTESLIHLLGPCFIEKELEEIEKKNDTFKSQGGLFLKDINHIAQEKWGVSQSTTKLYIKKGLLPKPIKRVIVDKKSISLYPLDFIRHLNFVRICLKHSVGSIDMLASGALTTDYDLLSNAELDLEKYDEDALWTEGSFWFFEDGLHKLREGFKAIKDAIHFTFRKGSKERKAYLKQINLMENKFKPLNEAFLFFENQLEQAIAPSTSLEQQVRIKQRRQYEND